MMFVAQHLVIGNQALKLLNQPVNHHAANQQQQAERSQEQPAVVHAGGVVHGVEKIGWGHVSHGLHAHQPHRAALGADLRAIFRQHHLRDL